MEYERSLFKVYEKTMEGKQHWCSGIILGSRICMTICAFSLLTIFLTHLSIPQGNACMQRAFEQYINLHNSSLFPSKKDAYLMSSYSIFGDTFDSSSLSSYALDSDESTNSIDDNSSPNDAEPTKENPIEPQNRTDAHNKTEKEGTKAPPKSSAKNKQESDSSETWFNPKQNRTNIYMKGDIINFFIISGLDSNLTSESNPAWPYIKPKDIEANRTQATIISASEEYYALKLARRNYGWFTINHTIPLPMECYTANYRFWLTSGDNKETIFIIDIINTFKKFARDMVTIYSFEQKEYWAWDSWELKKLDSAFSIPLQAKFYQVIYLTIGLVIVSFSAALYTKVVSMLSPLILYFVLKCCRGVLVRRNPENMEMFMNHFYKAFTWIGIYLQTIQRNRNAAKFEAFFIFSIFLTLVFFYFTYICLAHLTSRILFPSSIPNELDGNLFGFMATIELICMFFYRTRETLYYLPKITFLTMLAFLLYVNFTAYGYYMKAFIICNWFVLSCNFYCIGAFEIPAAALRDSDFGKPCLARPRNLYQPLFSLTWYHDLPPFWTLFIPLYDRNNFTPEEMSLLDHNYALLNGHLRNRGGQVRMREEDI